MLGSSHTNSVLCQGHSPAVAIYASHARYKREAYRGSEFAPRILADNGLKVIMKVRVVLLHSVAYPYADPQGQSDHPNLDSRFLLYEAQQAHYVSFTRYKLPLLPDLSIHD